MIRLITVDRARQHLAIEHDGVGFAWTGSAALAIIELVEHMAKATPPDAIETLGQSIHVTTRSLTQPNPIPRARMSL